MNNNVRIARELMKLAKTITAGSGVADAIESAIAPYGFTLSDVSKNSTEDFFVIPSRGDADCKGLFVFFNFGRYGRMITGSDGTQYGPFKMLVTTRYGFYITPVFKK